MRDAGRALKPPTVSEAVDDADDADEDEDEVTTDDDVRPSPFDEATTEEAVAREAKGDEARKGAEAAGEEAPGAATAVRSRRHHLEATWASSARRASPCRRRAAPPGALEQSVS